MNFLLEEFCPVIVVEHHGGELPRMHMMHSVAY